jgi:hypothetical protein
MGQLILFTPQAQLSAEENLRDFICLCRDELSALGASLDWADWKWEGFVHFTKLGVASHGATEDDRLDGSIIEFAKAYFYHQQGHHPTGTKNESKALRVVESALLQMRKSNGIAGLDISVLDEAAKIAREHYSETAAYHCGRELERLAKFVSEKQLIECDVARWKSPIKKPRDINIQTGPVAKAHRDNKLPSEEALNALAELFANRPTDPKDIFTTSTFAESMCAPSRGTEILSLLVDCEHEEPDKDGVMRYGWRFFSGKGFEGDIKWLESSMTPIAKEAIGRLRGMTEGARSLAKWLEENESRFFRHRNCPNVPDDASLTPEQAAAALGVVNVAGFKLSQANGAYTLNSLWQWVRQHQPEGFPWINKAIGLKYSNALYCMTRNMLHQTCGTSPVLLWVPDINVFNNDLGPRPGIPYHRSIFDRWNYTSVDGKPLKVTSHQARHLLNTIANRGGLSQDQIAKWSGRADRRQNPVYNQRSEFEKAADGEALDPSLTLFGPDGDVPPRPLISADDFVLIERGPTHITEFGLCNRGWAFGPCEHFRDCTSCQEHIFIKGEDQCLKRIQDRMAQVELDLELANEAIRNEHAGADRWHQSREREVARLRQLVAILEDPDIPNGSQIKLRDGENFSHLRRALNSKIGSDLIFNATNPELLSDAAVHLQVVKDG